MGTSGIPVGSSPIVGATKGDVMDIKDQIIDELYRILVALKAPVFVLAAVGSRGDTQSDEDILDSLQSWPGDKPEVLAVVDGTNWWGDEKP